MCMLTSISKVLQLKFRCHFLCEPLVSIPVITLDHLSDCIHLAFPVPNDNLLEIGFTPHMKYNEWAKHPSLNIKTWMDYKEIRLFACHHGNWQCSLTHTNHSMVSAITDKINTTTAHYNSCMTQVLKYLESLSFCHFNVSGKINYSTV